MNAPCKDIATLIEDNSSFAYVSGEDLFYSYMPEEKDNVRSDIVAVVDGAGSPPLLQLQKDMSDYYFSGATVYVRNTDYAVGYEIAFDIMKYLHGISNVTIDTTYYALIAAREDPQFLRWDENKRAVFIVNFLVQRRNN